MSSHQAPNTHTAIGTPDASPRMADAMPDWHDPARKRATPRRLLVGVLPGEGIGPEIIPVALDVLGAVASQLPGELEVRVGGTIGEEAERRSGSSLTPEVIDFCDEVFRDGGAILCGPGGNRFVYNLRRRFDLYCKFTPINPLPVLAGVGVVRGDARMGTDIAIVRENASGLYFGTGLRTATDDGDEIATHTFSYRRAEVERLIHTAGRLALRRRGRLMVAVKPNGVPEISELWRDVLAAFAATHPVDASLLEIDNALYQVVAAAPEFDVVAAPNLFGDMLSDTAALLLGSRGLSYSGNFGAGGRGVFQTGHGCAHDLAGRDVANPIGQIHSAAMMLREVFGAASAAAAIMEGVERALERGARTADIHQAGTRLLGTRAMGATIVAAVAEVVAERRDGMREGRSASANVLPGVPDEMVQAT